MRFACSVSKGVGFYSNWIGFLGLVFALFLPISISNAGEFEELPEPADLASDAEPPVPAFTGSYALVSDIDDTIKVTNVLNYLDLVKRYLKGNTTFAGMSTLFQGLAKGANQIGYLSGSPQSQKNNLTRILFRNDHFPSGNMLLLNWFDGKNTHQFKTEELDKIAKKEKSFLLFGDDCELDPITLTQFRSAHPEIQARIYIHQVRKSALPKDVKAFQIPFEVALSEFEIGTLTEDEVLQVGVDLLSEKNMDRVFPDFKKCVDPTTYKIELSEKAKALPRIVETSAKVAARMIKFCELRKKNLEALPQS